MHAYVILQSSSAVLNIRDQTRWLPSLVHHARHFNAPKIYMQIMSWILLSIGLPCLQYCTNMSVGKILRTFGCLNKRPHGPFAGTLVGLHSVLSSSVIVCCATTISFFKASTKSCLFYTPIICCSYGYSSRFKSDIDSILLKPLFEDWAGWIIHLMSITLKLTCPNAKYTHIIFI